MEYLDNFVSGPVAAWALFLGFIALIVVGGIVIGTVLIFLREVVLALFDWIVERRV